MGGGSLLCDNSSQSIGGAGGLGSGGGGIFAGGRGGFFAAAFGAGSNRPDFGDSPAIRGARRRASTSTICFSVTCVNHVNCRSGLMCTCSVVYTVALPCDGRFEDCREKRRISAI